MMGEWIEIRLLLVQDPTVTVTRRACNFLLCKRPLHQIGLTVDEDEDSTHRASLNRNNDSVVPGRGKSTLKCISGSSTWTGLISYGAA